MRSKLNFLIGVSLKRKIKTKWFALANIILGIVVIGLMNIDSIISYFGGDFDKKTTIYVIDKSEQSYDLFKNQLILTEGYLGVEDEKDSSFIVEFYEEDEESAKELLKEETDNLIIVFTPDEEKVLDVKLISHGFIDTIDYQLISTSINNTKIAVAINESDIAIEEINKIYEPIEIDRIVLDETKNTEDESMEMIMTTVFPFLILPIFMLTIFLVQMIGAEVNDEKSTRGMEIIISNVSPATHFFAKVISGNLFVLIQGGLFVLFTFIGLKLRDLFGGNQIVNGLGAEVSKMIDNVLSTGIGEQLIYIIPLTILLVILTFVAYALLAGILASMTTNIEDFQQLQTPIVLISLAGYYLAMMAGMFKGALFIKVLSFVPLISAILSPSLLVMGQIGVFEVLISIVVLILFIWLLVKYGLKIYKVGILNYSSSGLWKKMFKALKN